MCNGPWVCVVCVGCLTSVVQVFLGVQAGTTLLTYPRTRDRVTRWVLWGIICGVIAAVLVNHTNIPINKNLWYDEILWSSWINLSHSHLHLLYCASTYVYWIFASLYWHSCCCTTIIKLYVYTSSMFMDFSSWNKFYWICLTSKIILVDNLSSRP